jgi:hypothetical protein
MNKLYSLFVCLYRFPILPDINSGKLHQSENLSRILYFLFPLVELLIWVFLVPVPSTLAYLDLRVGPQPSEKQIVTELGTFYISKQEVRQMALEWPATRASHALTALNMPALAIELLVSLPTSWPDSWHPANLSVDAWRSISFPFFCLPMWWFVGKGFDALQRREKPSMWTTVIAAIFSIGFLILSVGLTLTQFAMEQDGSVTRSDRTWWPILGMALWAILFISFPLAWLRERRTRIQGRKRLMA